MASEDVKLRATRVWFDTEFIEDGKTVELLSIGLVREDNETYYAEPAEADRSRADDWVAANVLPHLVGPIKPRAQIAREIIEFVGPKPEFWAYYADYDWVVLCQLYGRMIDLPHGWPMFCRDIKQMAADRGVANLPEQTSVEHHALADAQWNRDAWEFLDRRAAQPVASAAPAYWIFTSPETGVEHGMHDETHAARFRAQNPTWPETHLFDQPAAAAPADRDARAKVLANWLGYAWEGLRDGSCEDRGFPVWTRGQFGLSFQGGQEDLRRLVDAIITLKDKSPPAPQPSAAPADNAELVGRLKEARASDLYGDWLDGLSGAIAALQQKSPRAEAVVKPLEWDPFKASSPIGFYRVSEAPMANNLFGAWFADRERIGEYFTVEAAKAAAQSDYEQRILAALAYPLHQPAPEEGPAHIKFRREAVEKALTLKAGSFILNFDNPPDDNTVDGFAATLAIILAGYAFTLDDKGRLAACVAGDMGYAATGIVVDDPAHVLSAAPAPEPQAPVPDGVTEITDRMIAAAILAAAHHSSRTCISTDAMAAALRAALTAANERSR